jgi:hypothetical protein
VRFDQLPLFFGVSHSFMSALAVKDQPQFGRIIGNVVIVAGSLKKLEAVAFSELGQ